MTGEHRHQTLLAGVRKDVVTLILLLTGSLALGLLVNRLRGHPLPLPYQSKTQRLSAAVAEVAGKPAAMALSPADELPHIGVDELKNLLDRGEEIVVVDARASLFFRGGHVPRALSLPRESFRTAYEEHRAALAAPPEKTVIVYCQSAACEDSAMVAAALRDLGRHRVLILRGGWNEWKKRGFPVSTEVSR